MRREEYGPDAFVAETARRLEGIDAFSVGPCPGCYTCELPEDPSDEQYDMASEAGFRGCIDCDSCGTTYGGDVHPAHGLIAGELHHFHVCTDCLVFHANGDTPDEWYPSPSARSHALDPHGFRDSYDDADLRAIIRAEYAEREAERDALVDALNRAAIALSLSIRAHRGMGYPHDNIEGFAEALSEDLEAAHAALDRSKGGAS